MIELEQTSQENDVMCSEEYMLLAEDILGLMATISSPEIDKIICSLVQEKWKQLHR